MPRSRPLAQLAPLALALGVLAALPAAASATAGESVAYQVTAGHTGFVSGGALDRPPLRARWTRTLGVSAEYAYPAASTSYPLVAAGRVFVIAYDSAHAGGTLFALDSLTGSTLWSRGVDGGGALAYDNGRVFVAERSGTVVGIAADTGATQWARALPQSYQLQAPVAAGGVVYVDSSWDGGGLYALNAADGSTKWVSSLYTEGAPGVAGGYAYVSDDYEGATTAYSLTDGSLAWSGTSQCFVGSGHVVADGARVIGPFNAGCGSVVDAATGGVLDSIASSGPPAAAGDVAVVLDGLTLEGRSLSTGLLLWQYPGDGSLSSAPVIVNGTVYEGSTTGTLFAVDLRTGTPLWSGSIAPNGTVPGGAGLAAGAGLLVVGAGGTLTGLESTTPARPGLDLQIDAGPDGPTSSSAATLSFGSSDVSVPERCRLDDAAWSACHAAVSYGGLAAGPHMFEVQTVDPTDASTIALAVRGWSVDPKLAGTLGPTGSTGSTPTPPTPSTPAAGDGGAAATSGGGSSPPATTTSTPSGSTTTPSGSTTTPSGSTTTPSVTATVTSPRTAANASAALARSEDLALARTLAAAGATLLRGETHAQLRARPAIHLYARSAAVVSIQITARVKGRSITVGRASAKLAATGARNVRLTLTPAGKAALAAAGPGKLSLVVRATVAPTSGAPTSAAASVRV